MTGRPHQTIAQQLTAGQLAIKNFLADAEIMEIVSEFGYAIQRLNDGLALHTAAMSAVELQTSKAGDQQDPPRNSSRPGKQRSMPTRRWQRWRVWYSSRTRLNSAYSVSPAQCQKTRLASSPPPIPCSTMPQVSLFWPIMATIPRRCKPNAKSSF
jgi:hypothetical protein